MSKLKFIYRALRYKYKLDVAEIKSITDLVQQGGTVVDIGAHKGAYLYWLRKNVGKTGKVYAFEPQPILYDYLVQQKKAFKYDNVKIEHKGVSSQKGQFSLYVPSNNGKGSSPGATLNQAKAQEEDCIEVKVQTVTLDDYFSEAPQINFIKMDVEGHEMEVFKGASNLLQKHRPILMFECEQRHNKNLDIREIFQYLEKQGYRGQFFHDGKLKALQEFSVEEHQANVSPKSSAYGNNFLFKPI